MKRTILTVLFCLPAGPGLATFEIRDPAAEAMDDLEKERNGTATAPLQSDPSPGNLACSEYVRGREKHSDTYWSALKWLVDYLAASGAGLASGYDPDEGARWVAEYCRDNPGHSLAQAAAVMDYEISTE